jgi:hypothetical protein
MGFGVKIGFSEMLQLVTIINNNAIANLHTLKITITQAESQAVIVFTSRCSVTVPNNRDSSALVLTSLRAGYYLTTNSLNNRISANSCNVKVKVILRQTVSRPVSLGVKALLGPKNTFLLLSDSSGFIEVGRPL